VLKPFLQDVVQFAALSQTLFKTSLSQPGLVLKIIPQVGLLPLLDWMVHYVNLGAYSALYPMGKAIEPWMKNLPPIGQYYYHRWVEAWQYGSGGDYSIL
ncbi:MAG TPA: FAD-dependent oxidoreductase, partial [Cyanobacteria bacterium UBA11368]|nr:FAD-dependent oxidoreductase [Cyanobacteria bacterium UBA11368]